MRATIKFVWKDPHRQAEIHSISTSVADLESGRSDFTANGGCHLTIKRFKLTQIPNYVDYLLSGWQLGLSFAIDCTKSNGMIGNKSSLHTIGSKNEYINTIKEIGCVLEPYNPEKLFATYGFGGKHINMLDSLTNDCFAIN